jgi:phosphatidate phosphatase APP1
MLGITRRLVVRAYDGYGDEKDVIIQGHVLKLSPLPRKRYRQNFLVNLFGLIRMFMVVPEAGARVLVVWNGETRETTTDRDGYYKLEWRPLKPPSPGWQEARVSCISPLPSSVVLASASCNIFIPHEYQFSFVSDIDDTFLVSHSSRLLKRLYVLFTRNARSRKAFDGVANHYRLLANASLLSEEPNPFFYVSSSEWNLYDYIREFCRKEELPRGVFLLSSLKRLRDMLKTGQGKHGTKYIRIARVMKSYARHKYVLLGDNSQQDPYIYEKIVQDFPGFVYAVYIRNVRSGKAEAARKAISSMESLGVRALLFTHSREAIAHSKMIGLVKADA